MKKTVLFSLFCGFLCFAIHAKDPIEMSFGQRAEATSNSLSARLLELMEIKKTNLAVAADVTCKEELLQLADILGPEICMLKTHIDILKDFDGSVIEELQNLANKHTFLICEDRKFADIGNTVKNQYKEGIYRISDWADLVTVHALPGPGILDGLMEAAGDKQRGVLLLVEMSSKQNLADHAYSKKALEMAGQYPDFVVGLITQKQFIQDPGVIHMTPGVKIRQGASKDHLGQQYNTPDKVVTYGSDIIIVGRGIIKAQDPLSMAKQYRKEAWDAYQKRISQE